MSNSKLRKIVDKIEGKHDDEEVIVETYLAELG